MIPAFYTSRPEWREEIDQIVELLGRVSLLEEQSGRSLELRRANRLRSVQSSTAIEGNQMTLAQVEALAEGQPVLAPPREVQENQNALAAYDALASFDPWSVDDFLRTHAMLTRGLIQESGAFRTVDVDIVNTTGEVIHTGSRAAKVPRLIAELFQWASTTSDHPLIVSSAVHFLIEHIHPFRDGNGRIGRLWQTLILARWRPMLSWLPTENLIRQHQQGYYEALQRSREPEIDAAVFIDYMLGIIHDTLMRYATTATITATGGGDGGGDQQTLLRAIGESPHASVTDLAAALGRSRRTIERRLAELKAAGRIRRNGSARSGHWEITT